MGTETYAACPEPPECRQGFIYTVKQGDTLYLIARRFGIRLQDLIAANPQIKDPDEVRCGQRICVPFPEPPACPNGFYYTVERGDTLFSIAQKFGVTVEALRTANPQIIDPNKIYPGQRICIPVPPVPECPGGFVYQVVQGDTIFLIAQRFGVTVQAILAANPQIVDPDKIYPGQEICIPLPPAPPCPGGTIYTVVQGDTMFLIAQRSGITLQALIAANPQVVDPNKIYPGQELCIPPAPPPPPPPPPECPGGFIYTVAQGDTMFLIAQRFGVSLQALIAANPQIEDPNMIVPGQRICVPVPAAPPCPNGTLYTVQQGDTMFLIAQRNGITLPALIAANPQVVDPNRIYPGQVLCVPRPPMPPKPPTPECPEGFLYTVVKGDSMWKIAQRFGISLEALIAANPQVEDPNMILPGQKICVPRPTAPECPEGTLYTVQRGDTMFLIAQRNGITLQALIAANPQVVDPNKIYPGQVLCIPRPAPPPPPPCPECPNGFLYTVQKGDTMFLIARRFGVTLEALIAANPQIENPNQIKPGQPSGVPRAVTPPPDPGFCPEGQIHVVERGETMFTIARKYGVTLNALIAANPQITDPNLIFPGQHICVPIDPPATATAGLSAVTAPPGWRPGPWPPGHTCMHNCHMLHPTAEARRHGVYGGCAYVADDAEHPMMGVACYGMPQPSKMGSCRYYFCWAEARGGQRVCFRLHPKAGVYSGDHHYRAKTPVCWVRMYVTAEKDKDPKQPSKYLMLDTRM